MRDADQRLPRDRACCFALSVPRPRRSPGRLGCWALPALAFIAGGVVLGAPSSAGPALAATAFGFARLEDGPGELLIQQLGEALRRRDPARLDQTLRGLRALRDPALRPLFAQLATSSRGVLRKHGILGSAELEQPPRVDLLGVKTIPTAAGQLDVLGEALRSGLLETAQLEEVARWPGLEPSMLALVIGRLRTLGQAPDVPALTRLAEGGPDSSPAAALLAALELREIDGAARVDKPLEDLFTGTSADRNLALGRMLEHIRERRLSRSADLAQRVLNAPGSSADLRLAALAALIAVAPTSPDTGRVWSEAARSEDTAELIRLGLIGLDDARKRRADAIAPLPAAIFEPFDRAGRDEIVRLMGRVGLALASGDDARIGDLAGELARRRHLPTLDWAERLSATLAPDAARAVRLAVVESARTLASDPPGVGVYEVAVRAARAAVDADPASLTPLLASAGGTSDEPLAGAILYGALQSVNPAASELARAWQGTPAARSSLIASSLATILLARHSDPLTPEQGETLAGIARAGNGLPEPARVQATWLALRARGQDRVALARVMADDGK